MRQDVQEHTYKALFKIIKDTLHDHISMLTSVIISVIQHTD